MKQKQSYAPAISTWRGAPNIEYRLARRGLAFRRNYVNPVTGERERHGRGLEHLTDVAEAVEFVSDEKRDLERGITTPPSGKLLLDVAQEAAKHFKDPYKADRVRYLERYLLNVLGNGERPAPVTIEEAADIGWLYDCWRNYAFGGIVQDKPETTYKSGRGGCSLDGKQPHANSVKKFFDAMKAVYDYAIMRRLITENPARNMPEEWRPKGTRASIKRTVLTSAAKIDEAVAMADEWYAGSHSDTIATMAYCNTRRGETLGLQNTDVDLKANTITFHGQWRQHRGKWEYVPWLKGQEKLEEQHRRPLVVDIPPKLRPRLVKRIEANMATGTRWLFPNATGERPKHENLARTMTKLGERLGFDRFSTHDFKHTGLTLMGKLDATGEVVKDAGNHTDKRTTEIYIHDIREREERRQAVTQLRKAAGIGH